jgi:hypothetical protein
MLSFQGLCNRYFPQIRKTSQHLPNVQTIFRSGATRVQVLCLPELLSPCCDFLTYITKGKLIQMEDRIDLSSCNSRVTDRD